MKNTHLHHVLVATVLLAAPFAHAQTAAIHPPNSFHITLSSSITEPLNGRLLLFMKCGTGPEVPNHLIGKGTVHAWATVSLYGHAPEMQVSGCGLPMITHLFLNDPANQEVKETFNKSVPSDDIALFSGYIADYTQKMTTYGGSAVNPEEYGKQMVSRLCPNTLPYELGTAAPFDVARFNGRPLGDDVQDVMLTLATNRPIQDGAAPDRNRIRTEFPYFGEPYSKEEQKDVVPWHPRRSH